MTTLIARELDLAQKDIKQPVRSVPVFPEESIACAETRALFHALNECIGSETAKPEQD